MKHRDLIRALDGAFKAAALVPPERSFPAFLAALPDPELEWLLTEGDRHVRLQPHDPDVAATLLGVVCHLHTLLYGPGGLISARELARALQYTVQALATEVCRRAGVFADPVMPLDPFEPCCTFSCTGVDAAQAKALTHPVARDFLRHVMAHAGEAQHDQ